MSSNRDSIDAVIARMRDELLNLGVLLENAEATRTEVLAPECDQTFKRLFQSADATRRFAVLVAPPHLEAFDPVHTLQQLSGRLRHAPSGAPKNSGAAQAPLTYGDPQKLYECVYLMTQNIQLQRGAGFQGELAVEDLPRLVIRVSPAGGLPEAFHVDGHFTLDWDRLGQSWTAATHGGHLARAEEVVVGYLGGDRPVYPPPEACFEWRIIASMQRLSRLLLPWRGAIGMYEPGYMAESEMVAGYRDVVRRAFGVLEELKDG